MAAWWRKDPQTVSNLDAVYHTTDNLARTAGYVGLESTEKLLKLYQSQAWHDVRDPYEKWRRTPVPPLNKRSNLTVKFRTVLIRLQKYSASSDHSLKFGETDADVSKFTNAVDWACHFVLSVLRVKNDLPGGPQFGPFPGESSIEAWNRAFQLHLCLAHFSCDSKKAYFIDSNDVVGNNFKDVPAQKPAFMIPASKRKAPSKPQLPAHDFMCNWTNRGQVQPLEGGRLVCPRRFRLADPRVYEDDVIRDWIRRRMQLAGRGIDIEQLHAKVGEEEYQSHTEWADIQRACRDDATKDGVEFFVSLKHIEVDDHIFEADVPAGLEDTYRVDDGATATIERVTPVRTGHEPQADADALAPTLAGPSVDINTPDGPVEAIGRLNPTLKVPSDFSNAEDSHARYGIDLLNDLDNPERFKHQKEMAFRMRQLGAASKASNFKSIKGDEILGHVQAHAATEDPESLHVMSAEERSLHELTDRMRGGESNVGPSYLDSCKLLRLDPKDPQMEGSNIKLHAHQVTAVAFCVSRMFGKSIATAEEDSTEVVLPTISYPLTRGGILADDMGLGKTHEICGLLHYVVQRVSFEAPQKYMPSLIIAPNSIVVQWYERIKEGWPLLKPYLFYGTRKSQELAQHRDAIIEAKDVVNYPKKVRKEIAYHFDLNNSEAERVVWIASYGTIRSRTSYQELDEDTDDVKILSRLKGAFRVVVLDEAHAIKNVDTKIHNTILGLNAEYRWLVTGVPLQNREMDIWGMLKWLWRERWLKSVSEADMESLKTNNLTIYSDDVKPAIRRLRLRPVNVKSVLSLESLSDKVATFAKTLELIYLRRTRSSLIPKGDGTFLPCGKPLPTLQIRTAEIHAPHLQAAESQFHHAYYFQQFTAALAKGGKKRDASGKSVWTYPTLLYRSLCLLADSLACERLITKLAEEDIGSLALDVQAWRSCKPPPDVIWWARTIRKPTESEIRNSEDALKLLFELTPRLQWAIREITQVVCKDDRTPDDRGKIVIFFEWGLTGLLLELIFKALLFRVAIIHPGMSDVERLGVLATFNNHADNTIEILLLSYRLSRFGVDATGANHIILFEPATNINAEFEAIFRLYREGQTNAVCATRLFMPETFDRYRESKSFEKMIPEVAHWSTGAAMQQRMKDMVASSLSIDPEEVDLDKSDVLAGAARLIIQNMVGQNFKTPTDSSQVAISYLTERMTRLASHEAMSDDDLFNDDYEDVAGEDVDMNDDDVEGEDVDMDDDDVEGDNAEADTTENTTENTAENPAVAGVTAENTAVEGVTAKDAAAESVTVEDTSAKDVTMEDAPLKVERK